MRAVNLIPADAKPSAAGRSGGGVYVLLAGLVVLVVLAGAFVSTANTVADRKAELARVEASATAAEAKAAALAPYTRFTQMREARVRTVSTLAASRFDWSTVFHEIARVIPADTWLTAMKGSVAADPAGGVAAGAGKVPAVDIAGCTTGHKSVARTMVRLRLMDGVAKVGLTSSNASKSAAGAAAAAAGADAGPASDVAGCAGKKGRSAQFTITVTFAPIAGPADPAATAAPQATPQPVPAGATK